MPHRDFLDILPLYPNEDEATIRARWDEWANEGLDPVDDVNRWTDTREGSMYFMCTKSGVRESAREYDLMGTEVIAAASPLFAWGQYLDYQAEVRSLARLAATPAAGFILLYGDPGTVIPAGLPISAPLLSPEDQPPVFEVTVAGVLDDPLDPPANLFENHYTPGGSLAANTYRYVVTAVDPALGETTVSNEDAAVVASGSSYVNLFWDAMPAAASFRVYRKTGGSAGPPYDYLASVPAGQYFYTDNGVTAPNATLHPPVVNGSSGTYLAPVRAQEPGEAGNVAANAVTVIESPVEGLTGAVNTTFLGGGTDEETDEALAERVLQAFQNLGAANVAQYTSWASNFAGVGRVSVIPEFAGPGTVLVVAMTASGDPVSQVTLDGLQTLLDPPAVTTTLTDAAGNPDTDVHVGSTAGFRPSGMIRVGSRPVSYTLKTGTHFQGVSGWDPAEPDFPSLTPVTQSAGAGLAPISHMVVVKTATALDVDVAATIEPEAGYSLDGASGTIPLRAKITEALEGYINSVLPGGEIVRSQVISTVAHVAGVHDVNTTLTLNGGTANITAASYPIPQAPALDDVTLTEGSL